MADKPVIRVPALSTPMFTDMGFMSDGFLNFVTRVGTSSDKASHGRYWLNFFDKADAEAAYRTSWFRKICDIVPFDEVREWRTWAGADDDQITLIDTEEKRLGFRQAVKEARTLARKDGGAAILLSDGGDASQAWPDTLPKGGLKYIVVLSRYELIAGERQLDPAGVTRGEAPFGWPKYYMLANAGGTPVHWSRVLRFLGNPIRQMGFYDGWGDSIWIELRDAVRRVDATLADTASLVDEAKVDVMKLKNLANNLATAEGESLLVKRFSAANTLKSIVNALVLDADDEHEQKTLTFQGLKDVNEIMLLAMAGMADIPQTRLYGRSPQGMNATGDSDLKNYYDRIRAGQTVDLEPIIKRADDAIIMSALGTMPPDIYYEWTPLYQMTEKEASEIEAAFATAASTYANAGLVPDPALSAIVKGGIIERGQWPGAQKAYDEADAAGDVAGIEAEPTPEEQALTAANIATANARAADPMATQNQNAGKRPFTGDAAPRTLYVRRQLLNAGEFLKWAKDQGFKAALPAADLHVTIAFSRTPVDWMKVPEAWSFGNEKGELVVKPGGARLVEKLGPKATVLEFVSSDLAWRHMAIIEAGATSEYPDYQPHVTITWGETPDLKTVTPYAGELRFGPEIFEEVKDGWQANISEAGT